MLDMSPWQMILWIVALGIAMTPIVSIMATVIFNAYYLAKEKHDARVAKSSGEALKSIAESINLFKKKIEKDESEQ